MANRTWRNELENRSYMYGSNYGNQMNYQNNYERRYNSGGYREDFNNRRGGKREFPGRFDSGVSPKRGRDMQTGGRRNYKPNVVENKNKSVRYNIRVPRTTFNLKEGTYSILKSRYSKLYVPSDFFHSDFRWHEVFQLHTPMEIGKKTVYQIFNKDVEPPTPFSSELTEPADANFIYSAKVMLLHQPSKEEIIKNVCEGSSSITRSIQFLVGSKGKAETMAIGGPWSPSLDGQNPDEDPQVLINTAIRTCKQLTGIDLSACKEWHRFVEFHYYRPADRQGLNASSYEMDDIVGTEKDSEYRVETVVIFIPSIWDCIPSVEDWEEVKKKYAAAVDLLINPPLPEPNIEIMEPEKEEETEQVEGETEKVDENEELKKDEVSEESKKDEVNEEPKPEAMETDKAVIEPEVESKTDESQPEANTEEPVKVEVLPEVKVLSDKDKKKLERIYKPLDNPAIIIHPNKEAKNGKFDCQLMSLSALMEYRVDDQKEYTFEVSVFAEQFYEMLQRDAAFDVYKTLLMVPPQADAKEAESSDAADKTKNTLSSDSLLNFCVFDLENAGFIKDHDLEDIIHSIGLDLAKSQARKLIGKAIGRKGSFYYKETTLQENLNTLTNLELSKGNKVNLRLSNDHTVTYIDSKQNTNLKIKKLEAQIKNIEVEFNKHKAEMDSVRKTYHSAMDMENELRNELKELENKLHSERKSVRDANQQQGLYNSLMCMSRDVMDRAKNKIDRQFEKDAEREKLKEGEDKKTVENGSSL